MPELGGDRESMMSDTGRQKGPLLSTFDRLVKRLTEEALEVYGERLVSLVVFGSVGRGTPTWDSDIDVLLVARELPSGRMPRVAEFELVEQRLAEDMSRAREAGISTRLSPIIRTQDEMALGGLIFLDMVEDAKVLFDRNGFFSGFIREFKAKLEIMGSRRVFRAGAWHWVIKPDLRPGEVIDI